MKKEDSKVVSMSKKTPKLEKDDKNEESKRARQRIWSEAKHEVLPLSIGAVAMVCSSTINQRVPKLIGVLMDPKSSSLSSSTASNRIASDTVSSNKQINPTASAAAAAATAEAYQLVGQIVWLAVLGGTASFVRTYVMNSCQESIAARLRKELFSTLLIDRDVEWFQQQQPQQEIENEGDGKEEEKSDNANRSDPTSSSDDNAAGDEEASSNHGSSMSPAAVAVMVKDDVDTVSSTVTNTFVNLLRSTSSFVFATYNMVCINPQLVGLSLVVAPVVGTIALMTRKYIKKVTSQQQTAAIQSASFLEDRLNHITMVKMSNRQQDEIARYSQIQDEYLTLGKKAAIANGFSMGVMFGLGSTALCGVLYAGRSAVLAGKMTSGQLTSFGTYSFMLALGSAGIIGAMSDYSKGIQCAIRLNSLLETSHDDDSHEQDVDSNGMSTQNGSSTTNGNHQQTPKSSNGQHGMGFVAKPMLKETQSFAMNNVSFHYKTSSSSPSNPILQNVSFTLSRGEVVVLVGKNGAGKSTIASLCTGLHKPSSGSIIVKNQFTSFNFLTDCDRSDQTQLVQVVPQHPVLFDMSIHDNVTYVRPDATSDEIQTALDVSNCNGFVSTLEGGLKYQVGRNGCRLSGGQRQRLGLARAYLSNPSFLVLDEPTSSLDVEGETAVKDFLRSCRSAGQGVLVITHRARTLELADRILVLKDGSIVEEGSLKELQLKKNGELVALMPDLE